MKLCMKNKLNKIPIKNNKTTLNKINHPHEQPVVNIINRQTKYSNIRRDMHTNFQINIFRVNDTHRIKSIFLLIYLLCICNMYSKSNDFKRISHAYLFKLFNHKFFLPSSTFNAKSNENLCKFYFHK